MGVAEEKLKIWKRRQNEDEYLNFHLYNTLWLPEGVHKIWKQTLAPIGAKKSVTDISIREEEKWTNKGTDKQYVAAFLLHNTTHH